MTIASSLIVTALAAVMNQFGAQVNLAAADATAAYNVAYGLTPPVGQGYGRYFFGQDPLIDYQDSADDVADLITQGIALRAGVATTVINAQLAASDDPATFSAAVIAMTEALRAACANPADAVRLLTGLARFEPTVPDWGSDATGVGMAVQANLAIALVRRQAGISLALATADYQPSSQEDAAATLEQVAAAIDEIATAAADSFDDQSYAALENLRTCVETDLTTRGASLSPIVTRTVTTPLPSLVLAYRFYQDATTADDLVARNDPPHPAFMPLVLETLA